MAIYVTTPDELTRKIVAAAFPSYSGRKIKIEVAKHPVNVVSFWDGGSRDYFVFVRLADFAAMDAPPTNPMRDEPGARDVELPEGVVCVKHSIFCGKDLGITIHVHPSNATPLLPAQTGGDLSTDEKVVLYVSRALKSFARLGESGMGEARYNEVKAALIAKGLLNKAGAITAAGKNAAQGLRDVDQIRRNG